MNYMISRNNYYNDQLKGNKQFSKKITYEFCKNMKDKYLKTIKDAIVAMYPKFVDIIKDAQ